MTGIKISRKINEKSQYLSILDVSYIMLKIAKIKWQNIP